MSNLAPFPSPTVSRESKRRILNASTLKALAPPLTGSVDHFDDRTPGLSLRITITTSARGRCFFATRTVARSAYFGCYPAVTLADARTGPRGTTDSGQGGDPVAEKRAAREVLTFGELGERHRGPRQAEQAELGRRWRQLDASLLPKWRNRPAAEVTAEDLLVVLNAKVKAGAPVAANRVRALVSRIYTLGAEQRLVLPNVDPVLGVKKPTKETTRDRVLTDDEIRRLWGACATQNPYVVLGFGCGS